MRIASVEGEVFTAEIVAQVQEKSDSEMIGALSGTLNRTHRLVRALALLPRIKESPMLRRPAIIRDMYCFKQYQEEPVYREVIQDQEARRAALRERLPQTLAELGVSLN